MVVKVVKLTLCVFVYCCSTGASVANSLTIDPDTYAPSTNLSAISPFVTLATLEGAPVYSAPVYPSAYDPNGPHLTTTGLLGSNVFSAASDINSEWLGFNSGGDFIPPFTRGALVITFTQPVTYISILSAEISRDAGPFSDDPLSMSIFDSSGALIHVQENGAKIAYNGIIDFGDGPLPAFPVYFNEYSGTDIWRVIISGESEPTTLDRLTFRSET
jgi:hypothetical protein